MGNSLVDLFKAETEFDVKATEMYALMREAVKAEFLLNAAKCDIPNTYARQMATGVKEDEHIYSAILDVQTAAGATAETIHKEVAAARAKLSGAKKDIGSGSVGIVRKHEQRVEWIDIQDIIRKGRAGVSIPPGTEINFTLKNGDPASAVVVGTDHYEVGDCVFWFRRIVGRHCMNKNGSNKGGFSGAEDMREYLEEIYSLLPDDLQSAIALHKTVQKIDGETFQSENRLFLPSVHEERGANDWAEYNGTDKQFPFFEERRNRVAYDEDGDPCWYWTADPSAATTTYFCFFFYDGFSYDNGASLEGGVAPLFIIK